MSKVQLWLHVIAKETVLSYGHDQDHLRTLVASTFHILFLGLRAMFYCCDYHH